MMTRGILSALAALALAGVVLSAPKDPPTKTGEKVTLKQWCAPGAYEMTMVMDMSQDIALKDEDRLKQEMSQTQVVLIEVGKADAAGCREIRFSWKRMKHTMKMGETTMSFDSAAPRDGQDPNMVGLMGRLMKARITVVLGADGKVKQVKGFEKLLKEMGRQGGLAAGMMKNMEKQMGDAFIKEVINKGQEMMPEGGARVGETWENDAELQMPFIGKMAFKQKCKLKAVEKTKLGKVAVIEYEGKVNKPKGGAAPAGPVRMTFDKFDIHQTGQMRLNLNTGMLESSTLDQSALVGLLTEVADEEPVTMNFAQATNMRVNVRKVPPQTLPASQPAK